MTIILNNLNNCDREFYRGLYWQNLCELAENYLTLFLDDPRPLFMLKTQVADGLNNRIIVAAQMVDRGAILSKDMLDVIPKLVFKTRDEWNELGSRINKGAVAYRKIGSTVTLATYGPGHPAEGQVIIQDGKPLERRYTKPVAVFLQEQTDNTDTFAQDAPPTFTSWKALRGAVQGKKLSLNKQEHRINVVETQLDASIKGFTHRAKGICSVYIRKADTAQNKLFTLAHELGHLFMQHGTSTYSVEKGSTEEMLANLFASICTGKQGAHPTFESGKDLRYNLNKVSRAYNWLMYTMAKEAAGE